MRPEDRYRFVLLMSFEDIYEAHMWSQNCLTREEINAGQCGIGAIFRAMAVEDPNDSSWISYTEAMLSLHPHFASPPPEGSKKCDPDATSIEDAVTGCATALAGRWRPPNSKNAVISRYIVRRDAIFEWQV